MARGWLLIPAWAGLAGAFAFNLRKRGDARVGAIIGALGIQVALRWPHVGFQGCTALVGVIVVLPCLVSGYNRSRDSVRAALQWSLAGIFAVLFVGIIPIALGGLWASRDVTHGLAAAQGAITDVSSGTTTAAQTDLAVATADFADAHRSTGSWWTAAARLVPIVAQQRQAVEQAAAAGEHVTAVASEESGQVDYSDLHYQGGGINLTALEQLTGPLQTLNGAVTSANTRLGAIKNPWLLRPLSRRITRFQSELSSAAKNTSLAASATSHLPAILGAAGPRHYLVALETPSESRGLGGFIGAYAELVFNTGRVTLTRAGNTGTDLDNTHPVGRHLDGPPGFLARYGNSLHITDVFGNLSTAPDLPTTTDVISQIYPQAGGDHIDGVLAIDPYGLAALLQLTGPITVPGATGPLTSANAASFLLKQQYIEFANNDGSVRHDFLTEALKVAFSRLISGSLPGPKTLATDLDPAVQEGRILFWSNHPNDRSLIDQVHMSGAFPSADGGDLLSVITQNEGNNKIDAYLQRSIDDKVVVDPGTGRVNATLTITLHNDAPSSGLPAYVIGGIPGSPLSSGTNFLSLTVYSPLSLVSGTEDGATFPFGHQHEFGVSTYTTADDLASGKSDTFVLHLTGILSQTGYRLTVHQQPLVNRDASTVEVTTTRGWDVADYPTGAKWSLGTKSDQGLVAHFVRSG